MTLPEKKSVTSSIQEIVFEEKRPIPTYKGLYRFTTKRDTALLLPAVAVSIASGTLTPAFTILLGKIFTSFGSFSSGQISGQDLQHQVTLYVIGICIIGAAAWGLGWAHMSLWLANGENTAKRARKMILKGLMQKNMTWYDQKTTDNGVSGHMNKAIK